MNHLNPGRLHWKRGGASWFPNLYTWLLTQRKKFFISLTLWMETKHQAQKVSSLLPTRSVEVWREEKFFFFITSMLEVHLKKVSLLLSLLLFPRKLVLLNWKISGLFESLVVSTKFSPKSWKQVEMCVREDHFKFIKCICSM